MTRTLLPLTCALFLSSICVFAQEVPLTSVQLGPAPYARFAATTAATDDGTLIAWLAVLPVSRDIGVYVQRFDRDGRAAGENVLIDHAPLISSVALASDGTDFLLAYTPFDVPRLAVIETKLVRVAASGQLTMLPSVAPFGTLQQMLSVGRFYVIAYLAPGRIPSYAILDHSGVAMHNGVLTADAAIQLRMAALPGESVFVSWIPETDRQPRVAVLTATQLLGVFPPFFDPPGRETPADLPFDVATNGRNVIVVWTYAPTGNALFLAQTFALDGAPLSEPERISDAPGSEFPYVKVIWDGQQYLVAYANAGRPALLRVSETAHAIGAPQVISKPFGTIGDWTASPAGIVAAILGNTGDYGWPQIYSQAIAGGASASEPILVSQSFPDQHSATVAKCPDGTHAVVWVEEAMHPRVLYQQLGHTAAPPTVLHEDFDIGPAPSVACGAKTLVVSGTHSSYFSTLWVAAMDRVSGTVTTTNLENALPDSQTALAWNGSDFLLMWQYFDHTAVASRLDSEGRGGGVIQLVGPRLDAKGGPIGESSPSAAWTGSQFCTAWQNESDVGIYMELFAHSVEMTMIGPNFQRATVPASPPGSLVSLDAAPPAVIANGDCVAAWGQAPVSSAVSSGNWGPYELVTATVDGNGVFSRGITPLGITGARVRPAIAISKQQAVFGYGNHVVTLDGSAVRIVREYSAEAQVDALATNGDDLIVLLTHQTSPGPRRIFVDGLPPARRHAVPRF